MLKNVFRFEVMTAALVAAIASAGCATDSEELGTVGVALTANDASGARYRLTPGARLRMGGDTFFDEFSLDGDSAFIRVSVPPGDYSAELVHDAGHTTHWPLERTEPDGTVETVLAVLTTTMPAPVTITDGTMTNLVLRFSVPGFGPITFAEGSVDVSLEVTETAAGGVSTGIDGTVTATSVTRHADMPALLQPRLLDVMQSADINLAVRVTGPWQKRSATAACADSEITARTASHAGTQDLLAEATRTGTIAELCFYSDQTASIVVFSAGLATTPTFSDLGDFNYTFLSWVFFNLPAPVFDGTTLDLDPAVGITTALPATFFTRVAARPAMGGVSVRTIWYRATHTGNLRLTLALNP